MSFPVIQILFDASDSYVPASILYKSIAGH